MIKYHILITRTAQKQLDKLPDDVVFPLIETIQKLATNPRPPQSIKLKGREGYRIRKGNYRIIYDIYDSILTIEVIALGHRKAIYK